MNCRRRRRRLNEWIYIYILYIPRTKDHVFPFSFRKGSMAAFISHVSEAARAAGEQTQSKPEQTGSAGRASVIMNQGDPFSAPSEAFFDH